MKIVVVGIGYVGLSLAVLLSTQHRVIAIDVVEDKVNKINNRISPIKDDLIEKYLKEKELNLKATINAHDSYVDAEYVIISVPTNYNPESNYFDTGIVEKVICELRAVNKDAVVVIKSTVPVGFTDSVRKKFSDNRILFSPEFLRESKALYDNLYPSRIIVGCQRDYEENNKIATEFAEMLRKVAKKKPVDIAIMGLSEAEAVKLFSNTYLALRVSFFNELDTYAEEKGLNTKQIIEGVCLDERINSFYNNPSFGYGGYCLPKDTKQLLANYQDVPENLIKAIVDSNSTRKDYVAKRIIMFLNSQVLKTKVNVENGVIGIYRLTMKSNSDNFRESAIQGIITRLKQNNAKILIYEPSIPKGKKYMGEQVTDDLVYFKEKTDIIVANRFEPEIEDVKEKVYSRDIFMRD